ncbi:unnamed protein product [Trichogramma brassicae]|uniref:Uncharacterized protein n=1 Tax=Trichogramma brassicae TaxID=86971 RepID=A0A6H5HZ46_9HYME|nr:unnamed protein product [Trichogramma brassicae]
MRPMIYITHIRSQYDCSLSTCRNPFSGSSSSSRNSSRMLIHCRNDRRARTATASSALYSEEFNSVLLLAELCSQVSLRAVTSTVYGLNCLLYARGSSARRSQRRSSSSSSGKRESNDNCSHRRNGDAARSFSTTRSARSDIRDSHARSAGVRLYIISRSRSRLSHATDATDKARHSPGVSQGSLCVFLQPEELRYNSCIKHILSRTCTHRCVCIVSRHDQKFNVINEDEIQGSKYSIWGKNLNYLKMFLWKEKSCARVHCAAAHARDCAARIGSTTHTHTYVEENSFVPLCAIFKYAYVCVCWKA